MVNNTFSASTISDKGKEITYIKKNGEWDITWGNTCFYISHIEVSDIIDNFFIDSEKWYPLGSSMSNPTKGGLGEYIQESIKRLTSRHASAIAAVMYNENLIEIRGSRPIYIKMLMK